MGGRWCGWWRCDDHGGAVARLAGLALVTICAWRAGCAGRALRPGYDDRARWCLCGRGYINDGRFITRGQHGGCKQRRSQ